MFELVYDYTIENSIYDNEPYYNDDWYTLYYNGEELLMYDEDDYPVDLNVEVAHIRKYVSIVVPFIDDKYKNSELFRQGVEYTITTINEMYADDDYEIVIYYEND